MSEFYKSMIIYKIPTQTLKSFGADFIWPFSESDLGKCSMVKPVICIVFDSFNTKNPLEPINAQQLPGLTSG